MTRGTKLLLRSAFYCSQRRISTSTARSAASSSRKTDGTAEYEKKKRRQLDSFGTWDTRITFPLEHESSLRHGTLVPLINSSKVGVCSVEGRRGYNEDRYVIEDIAENILLLGVFDGHGGNECAEFCASRVANKVKHELALCANNNCDEQGEVRVKPRIDLEQLLTKVVLGLEEAFYKQCLSRGLLKKSSGTTATIALIRDGYELVLAHVGDSRAILCRDGQARALTTDHCPSHPSERERIERHGGEICYDTVGRYMVNKRLSMSRSIGDFDVKDFGVTATPDLIRMNFKHGKDSFLVLTTDGVCYVMNNSEIVECIMSGDNPQEAAEKLVDTSLLYASEDNLTVVVLSLGSWGKGDNEKTSMLYTLGRNMALTSRFN